MNNSHKKYLAIGAPVAGRRRRAFLQNQRGSLLIGIIATIVILSALSGGLLYIFSSSSLNPVSGNFAQRAYLNAEAGINYVKALYRNAQSPAEGKTLLQTYESEQTINMPDGGSAEVIISGLESNYVPAEATYVSGANATLTLTPTTGSFPDPPGFFRKRNDQTIYRYTGKTSDNGNIILTGISPSVTGTSGVVFVTNEQITIDSQGTVGLGLWNVNRKISYTWPLSGSKHGVSDPPPPPDNGNVRNDNPSFLNEILAEGLAAFINTIRVLLGMDPSASATTVLQWWFNIGGGIAPSSGCGLLVDSFGLYYKDGNAIRVDALTGTYGGGFFLPFNINNTYPSYRNFGEVWSSQGNRLSYDAQTKIKIDDGWFADRYLVGLTVRADSQCWANALNWVNTPQYGISFAKGHNFKFRLPTSDDIYIVFWRKFSESNYRLIAYKRIGPGEGIGQTVFFEDDMEYAVGETPTAWEVKSIDGSASDAWTMTSASSYSPSHSYKGEPYYTDPGKIILDKHYTEGLGYTSLNPNYAEIFMCNSSNACTSIEKWDNEISGIVPEKAELTIPNSFKPSTGTYLKFFLSKSGLIGAHWYINAVHIYGVFSDYMNDYTQWPTHDYWTAGVNSGIFASCMEGYRGNNGSATLISTPFDLPATVANKRNESLISPAFNTTGAGITDASEIRLTFKHKLQIYDCSGGGGCSFAFVEACQGSNCGATGDWTELRKYTSDIDDWVTARDNSTITNPYISLPSAYVNKTDVKIRFRLETSRPDKFPKWYVDDVKVATPKKLVDWATLGVRVREKLSPRSNEFEVFYGHPGAWNNGTGPNTIPYDVNRAPCPRDQNCWLPVSPINIMSNSDDKLTLVTANSSDPHANANPWRWWYDNDGDYRDTVDDGVTDYSTKQKGTFPTADPRPADSDGCVYTLEGGTSPYGSLEPFAIIKTSGSNCRTTDGTDGNGPNYTGNANRVEEFGIHVYSDITGATGITGRVWFTDKQVWITEGASQYGSGVQR